MVDVKVKLIEWMRDPENLTWEDILMLENMEKEHPYFQTIKSLIARHYMANNHILKTKKVNTASVYSLNRNTLRNFLKINKKVQIHEEVTASSEEVLVVQEISTLNEEIKENLEVIEEVKQDVLEEEKELNTDKKDSNSHLTKEPIKSKKEFDESETVEKQISEPKKTISRKTITNGTLEPEPNTKEEETTPIDSEENQGRKELLLAINKKLEELKRRKESYLKEVRSELNDSNFKILKRENQETEKKPKTTETVSKITPDKEINFSKLRGNWKESSSANTKPEKKQINTSSKAEKKQIEPEKPKNVFYSRLGNVLSDDSSEDVDRLLDYIKKTKKTKTSPVDQTEKKNSIISKFINEDPTISKLTKSSGKSQADLSKESIKNEFISENLAVIHEKQENYKKAISIYKKLILKFPEKKTYFTDRIEKLKNK